MSATEIANGREPPNRQRVFVLGATGTIGRATVRTLSARGHSIVCFVRPGANAQRLEDEIASASLNNVSLRFGSVTDVGSIERDGVRGENFEAVVSCLASRTGAPRDAWAIDHDAHVHALSATMKAGISKMVLLSALCVQKPRLEFQRAKLAFEKALIESGVPYSIVRPTAFFKSLSGQIDRVKRGKPFIVFGNGTLTACKPISDDDLARFMASCLDDERFRNRILPVGGPGDPLTPKQQGELLFSLLDREPHFRHVPVQVLDIVIRVLDTLAIGSGALAKKAELARIGRYYATESMLAWDPNEGRYDAASTPSFGSETLRNFYARILRGEVVIDRGDHAVFQ